MQNDQEVCSYLGLVDERGAYLTYPSYENRCYAPVDAETIPLNEQTFFCLGGNQQRCPRYLEHHARLQATPQPDFQPAQDAAGVMAAAAAIDAVAGDGTGDSADQGFSWSEEDDGAGWDSAEPGYAPPPPPPPPPAIAARSQGGRRPVWPLLLSAGTLVGVLMLCALASAAWLGFQALSAQIALDPSVTPRPGANITPPPGVVVITSTLAPGGGVVVIVATPTPEPQFQTATAQGVADADATGTAVASLPIETATSEFFFPTVTAVLETATPTWTVVPFVTPTPRDTPTLFPTNTPFPDNPTATWTPFPVVTATATAGAYSASFVANPTSILAGQSTTLTWTVTGVKAIYLDGEGVSGPTGTRTENPTQTTTYVLRIVKLDNTVTELTQTVTVAAPTPSATPTATPTATATPFVSITYAQDLSITSVDGSESSCRTGNGCALFQIQVRNIGNRPVDYVLSRTVNVPVGWAAYFCWGTDCEFGTVAPPKTLAVGARDTVNLNFRFPASLNDLETATVDVVGRCPACMVPPFVEYQNRFTVLVTLPTATPFPSATPTPTQLATATHTATPTATSASQ